MAQRRKAEQPKLEIPAEDLWFASMNANLTKYEELREANVVLKGKMDRVSERAAEHNVEIGKLLNALRDGIPDMEKRQRYLRGLREHHRWRELYEGAFRKHETAVRLNVDTMELMLRQLHDTPYPGEEPLVYTADDGIE